MKKIVLIIAFILICLQGKSQQVYDTIIYYPPAVLNCPMWMDSSEFLNPNDPSGYYSTLRHYELLGIMCGYNVAPVGFSPTIGPNDTNTLNIRAYAQPYSLDSLAIVIGVAAKITGTMPSMSPNWYYFHLMDSSGVEVAYTQLPPFGSCQTPYPTIFEIVQGKYYFNSQVLLKDFYIAVDMPSEQSYSLGGTPYKFDHTCTFTEDSCLKIDRGCYQYEPPYLLKRGSTQWTRFDQDTIYYYYRKMHIGWFPIILVPRPDSLSLANEIDINNTCNILPNPAKNNIKIISQFKVKDIEIYNISGIKLKTIPINDYEKYIDISDLIQGTYIIKINTPRGIATKKILVE